MYCTDVRASCQRRIALRGCDSDLFVQLLLFFACLLTRSARASLSCVHSCYNTPSIQQKMSQVYQNLDVSRHDLVYNTFKFSQS
ncbi:hypothetical protein BRADI_2g48895v3 [Brachypodium distachyon]|uniref:Uncharacterized protein n=1 Tax=Brachypodium distachyon TaxID=15368 RepID=A0A2K2DEU7_BRADI|nr:hypothetical protein BRADI_2g48895v3 [Brachypodium distachyon]